MIVKLVQETIMRTADMPLIRRKLAELKDRPVWVHHVADAATGELLTTRLSQPVAPLSRADRLSRLGQQFDPSIFGSPTHRLTPASPHQRSPLGFLRFTWAREVWALGDTNDGHAWWLVAEDFGGENVEAMEAVLFDPPQGRCLLSLDRLGTYNLPGTVGRIRIEVLGSSVQGVASFEIASHGDAWEFHTFDLVFMTVPATTYPSVWVRMFPGYGLQFVFFSLLTLAPQRPDIGL